MISVGRFLLSAGERGRSHREDTTIPTQWREGGRIPRPGRSEGYQHSGWREGIEEDTQRRVPIQWKDTGRIPRYLHSGREGGYLAQEGYQWKDTNIVE